MNKETPMNQWFNRAWDMASSYRQKYCAIFTNRSVLRFGNLRAVNHCIARWHVKRGKQHLLRLSVACCIVRATSCSAYSRTGHDVLVRITSLSASRNGKLHQKNVGNPNNSKQKEIVLKLTTLIDLLLWNTAQYTMRKNKFRISYEHLW